MGPKKGRRVRKIEVFTDIPTEFELGDEAADIQTSREDRQQREREEEARKQQMDEWEREEARMLETTQKGVTQKWIHRVGYINILELRT